MFSGHSRKYPEIILLIFVCSIKSQILLNVVKQSTFSTRKYHYNCTPRYMLRYKCVCACCDDGAMFVGCLCVCVCVAVCSPIHYVKRECALHSREILHNIRVVLTAHV